MACCGGNPHCSKQEGKPMDEIVLTAGTTVTLDGLPFLLKEDVKTLGRKENVPLLTQVGAVRAPR